MVEPLGVLGGVAATSQLGEQVFGILSSAKKFYNDFQNAQSDHSEIFKGVKNVGAAIQSIASTLEVVTTDSGHDHIKQCLGGSDTGSLLEDAQTQLNKAEDVLHSCQTTKFRGKLRFVLKKEDIQKLQLGLSQVGIWLSVALSSAVIKTLMSGVSKSPQVEKNMQQKLEQIHTAIESVQKSITLDRSSIPQSANVAHPRRKTGVTNHDHSRRKTHHRSQRSRKYKTMEVEAERPRTWTSRRGEKNSRTTVSPVEDSNGFDNKNGITVEGSSGNPESSHQGDARQDLESTPLEISIQGSENQKTVSEQRFQLATPFKNVSYGSRITRHSTEDDNSSSDLSIGEIEEKKHVSKMPHAESESQRFITKSSSIGTAANMETEVFTSNFLNSDINRNSASSDGNSSTRSSLRSRSIAPDDKVEDHDCSNEVSSNFPDEEAEEPRYSSTQSEDLLQAFERMILGPNSEVLADTTDLSDGEQLFANGTWMSLATLADAPWGFLFFQRPDNWIQLALIPMNHGQRTIILDRIAKAAKSSPLRPVIYREDDGKVILKLYFYPPYNGEHPILAERTLGFGEGPPFHWKPNNIELPPDASPALQIELSSSFVESQSILTCVSSTRNLITLFEVKEGEWKALPYPNEIPVALGDQVLYTYLEGIAFRVRILNQDQIIQYQINQESQAVHTRRKDDNWLEHSLSQSLDFCRMQTLPGQDRSVAGLLCKTNKDEICLYRGHPWWGLRTPEFICAVKSESNFFVSGYFAQSREDYGDRSYILLYISPENEMQRIKFTVDKSDNVTFGDPSPVFPANCLSTTLEELALPGPLDYYKSSAVQNREDTSVPSDPNNDRVSVDSSYDSYSDSEKSLSSASSDDRRINSSAERGNELGIEV